MTSTFGPIIDGTDVEEALLDHLRLWAPTHVAEARRQRDPGETLWPNGIEDVRSFTVVHAAAEKWPEDQLPMYLAYSPGIGAKPYVDGEGKMTAPYSVVLTAIASGVDIDDTKMLARVYSSAAKQAILQHPDLGGFALATDFITEENFPVTRGVEAERSLMAVACAYTIVVENVMDTEAGIDKPAEDPDEEAPLLGHVKATDVEVELHEAGFWD